MKGMDPGWGSWRMKGMDPGWGSRRRGMKRYGPW